MQLALATTFDGAFDDAVAATRQALAQQGFGVLTEIDMASTLKQKIDVEMEPYLILGACNPPFAHRAVTAVKQIGLLLPCNVVVRQDGDTVHVEAMNPQIMSAVIDDDTDLREVADEVTVKLQAAINSL